MNMESTVAHIMIMNPHCGPLVLNHTKQDRPV
jgi:hypothetical protein